MVFKGLPGETYCIFSSSGIMLSTGVIESDIQRIPVPEGIIIARAGSYSLKPTKFTEYEQITEIWDMRVAHSSDTALCRGIVRGQFRSPDPLPERVTAGGSSIYGVLVYSWDDDARDGVYEITKIGGYSKIRKTRTHTR